MMPSRQRYVFIVAILAVLLSVGLGGWAWNHFSSAPQTAGQQQTPTVQSSNQKGTPKATGAVPVQQIDVASGGAKLIIPAIKVNAPIEVVGRDKSGRMDVPQKNQWEGVGWYLHGPLPGDKGSSVIDGHLDRPGGAPAVFWDLNKLKVGDEITVKSKDGQALHFRVMKTQQYEPAKAPLEQIFGKNDGQYLNLITCSGTWVPARGQTTHRLVVYTKRI